jgi:hypothetical protein
MTRIKKWDRLILKLQVQTPSLWMNLRKSTKKSVPRTIIAMP